MLMSSQYESSVLRQQLVASQVELSQLKDRGLVQATLRTSAAAASKPQQAASLPPQQQQQQQQPQQQPVSVSPPPSGWGSYGSKSGDQDAFRISLDYRQLKNKLKPTGMELEEESL